MLLSGIAAEWEDSIPIEDTKDKDDYSRDFKQNLNQNTAILLTIDYSRFCKKRKAPILKKKRLPELLIGDRYKEEEEYLFNTSAS